MTRAVAEILTPSTRRFATLSNSRRVQRSPLYAVPVFVLSVPLQTVQRYRRRRPDFVANEPWPTMLRPCFPRLSHAGVAHAIPSIALIAQVYRRARLLVSPTILGVDRPTASGASTARRLSLTLHRDRVPKLFSPLRLRGQHSIMKNALAEREVTIRVPASVVPDAESPDNPPMGAGIRSESAAAERDPAGRLLRGLNDPRELGAPQPPEASPSRLDLRKLIGLPGWRWSKQATRERAEAELEARRAEEAQAAMRAKLEEDLTAQIDTVRLQANTARAAQVAALEAEAAERLEATRRDAEAALGILATELETQAAKRLETTRRDADTSLAAREAELEAQAEAAQMIVETLRQHDAVLAKVRAEAQADVTQAEARVAELKQELADRLELQAAARDDALRGAAAAAQQHDAALGAVRVQLEASEARRVKLDQDFAVRIDTLRREADIARSTQVAAVDKEATERLEATRRDAESALAILAKELEAQADGRVEAARHNADTALAAAVGAAQAEAEQLLAETTQQHDVAVETVQAEAQADLSRAEHRVAELQRELAERVEADAAARDAALRTAAETARQHDGELAAVRAELEAAEARQVKLEQDFAVRVDTLRREADTARATQVAALETQAAQRLAAAVHDAESEAAQTLVETVRQHDATLAVAGAQLEDAEARRIER